MRVYASLCVYTHVCAYNSMYVPIAEFRGAGGMVGGDDAFMYTRFITMDGQLPQGYAGAHAYSERFTKRFVTGFILWANSRLARHEFNKLMADHDDLLAEDGRRAGRS